MHSSKFAKWILSIISVICFNFLGFRLKCTLLFLDIFDLTLSSMDH